MIPYKYKFLISQIEQGNIANAIIELEHIMNDYHLSGLDKDFLDFISIMFENNKELKKRAYDYFKKIIINNLNDCLEKNK